MIVFVGYPTDSTRATIMVNNSTISAAIYATSGDGITLRSVIINGNRAALGWMQTGLALIEMGGNSLNQMSRSF